MRSPRTGQAKAATRNGMVNTSMDVLPGSPRSSASVLIMVNAAACKMPTNISHLVCAGRSEAFDHTRNMNKNRVPRMTRVTEASRSLSDLG
jgi:hypothetical protein